MDEELLDIDIDFEDDLPLSERTTIPPPPALTLAQPATIEISGETLAALRTNSSRPG